MGPWGCAKPAGCRCCAAMTVPLGSELLLPFSIFMAQLARIHQTASLLRALETEKVSKIVRVDGEFSTPHRIDPPPPTSAFCLKLIPGKESHNLSAQGGVPNSFVSMAAPYRHILVCIERLLMPTADGQH